MFALTADAPQAARLFTYAAALLGRRDPREVVKTDTLVALHHDRVSQVLCTLQALAAAAALGEVIRNRTVIAGYSVGELAAWGVAGWFNATDALGLAASRAEVMDAVSQAGDGLLFVRGLSRDTVDRLCAKYDAAVAIVNPADAYILGGSRVARDAMAIEARALKATRVIDLPVEVASHTPRLARAYAVFREKLGHIAPPAMLPAATRLLSGIDGAPVVNFSAGLDKLAAQISQTVQWADCLQACVEGGANAFLELGPGSALSRMAAAAYPDIPARSLEDFRTLQGAREWAARHAAGAMSAEGA